MCAADSMLRVQEDVPNDIMAAHPPAMHAVVSENVLKSQLSL